MTRTIHDQFFKDCLQEFLKPLGKVETDVKVASEVRAIDLLFTPESSRQSNFNPSSLLEKFATTPAIIEPYRNPITAEEVRTCLSKALDLQTEQQRRAKREQKTLTQGDFPKLWILSPTISSSVITQFKAELDLENWSTGIYHCPEGLRTVLVAIHQLPETADTLWLRLLGRGRVQIRAISELEALPSSDPYRERILELVANMIAILEVRQQQQETLETEERELIMELSTVYRQRLQEATEQGIEQGQKAEAVALVLRLISRRVGNLTPESEIAINQLSLTQLEDLAEALLDFHSLQDLEQWLNEI